MTDYGMKVSKSGYDVKIANPDELVYSSKYNLFKIYGIYTSTLVVPGGGPNAYVDFDNPLSYPSISMHFFDVSAGSNIWRPMLMFGTIYYDNVNFRPSGCSAWYVQSSNKYTFKIYDDSPTDRTYTIKSIIFLDKFGI